MIFSPITGALPVLTQSFGVRPQYYAKYGLKGHPGLDFRAAVGTPIYAPCEGYLKYGDNGKSGYGKFATITSLPYTKEGKGREVTLAHLSRFIDRLDCQYVHMGDLIGVSGNTGDSTAPHLHMGYRLLDQNGKILNEDNGFHGFIDVKPYIVPLILPALFS